MRTLASIALTLVLCSVTSPGFLGALAASPWRTPSYADSAAGDHADGDDPLVRQAALDSLGKFNGSVVVVDTSTGRILTMINQDLALGDGFMPCSTVKLPVALAALSEGVIDRGGDGGSRLSEDAREELTQALARSDNNYFAALGRKLGFEKVHYYASFFGLGETAGLGIEGERPGSLTSANPRIGGVGRMSSFGEGITQNALQLAALVSAIANGGTLYYLQYPRSAAEADRIVPRVKRRLEIFEWISEIKPGMLGAVVFGTAKKAVYDPDLPILGKTGTCTDRNTPTHLGWFGSFNDAGEKRLAVVVLLTGGAAVDGAVASEIAGDLYRRLSEERYFERGFRFSPAALVTTDSCCAE